MMPRWLTFSLARVAQNFVSIWLTFSLTFTGRTKTDLRNLIESTGWSLAKAMEMLRIPPEEKEHLEKELKKKH